MNRERRKQVRVRLRPDLDVASQQFEGQTFHVVKDPASLRYWRFENKEYYLLRKLDGAHTLEDARQSYEQEFRPERVSLEEVEAFAQQLLNSGIAFNDAPQAGDLLLEQRTKQRRSQQVQRWSNLLSLQFSVFDPDRLLTRLRRYSQWLFTVWFLLAALGLIFAALFLVGTHFDQFRARLPDYKAFFSAQNLICMWLTLGVVKIIHEFGHGLTCKAFGGEVHEMGILFLCFSPTLYCNISDAWIMPSKWKRMLISAAGILVELIIAAIATFVWWNTTGANGLHQVALSLMVVCSVSTVLFNGNPLMRYDGYYVLADWLEIPNLSQRANRFVTQLFQRRCLGMNLPPDSYMEPGRKTLFVVYALTSYVYRWTVTFGILWFLTQFLKPYKLGGVGAVLAVAATGSMIGVPLYRLCDSLSKRGRWPEMKGNSVTWSAAALVGVLAIVVLVPLPVSRVRQTGLVQIVPEAATPVHVPLPSAGARVPGVLRRLHVRDGQLVEEGRVLAEFYNREVEEELNELRSQLALEQARLVAAEAQLRASRDAADRSKRHAEAARATGERDRLAARLTACESMQRRLVLRAPRAGVVINPPRVDEVGRQWDHDRTVPFCTIADPGRLRVLLPISPADYRLLQEDAEDLSVDLRIQGLGSRTWHGRVTELPPAEARDIPVSLTERAGGPVTVKQGCTPNALLPQEQIYLVPVDIVDADASIAPGTRAQVKIHCRWRSAAWWSWRTMATLFDLGL